MGETESEAAVQFVMNFARRWGEPGFIEHELPSLLTDDFERQDRRRLVGVPGRVGRSEYLRQQQTFFDLGSGRPTIERQEILATRGERLVASRSIIVYPNGSETPLVVLRRLDPTCERCELLILFDNVGEALRELTRLARLLT